MFDAFVLKLTNDVAYTFQVKGKLLEIISNIFMVSKPD